VQSLTTSTLTYADSFQDFTKVLFVVFFYSALFPLGFFFGFLILSFQYLSDKYCLVRIYGWNPLIGSELAVFSRRYFFTSATLAFALVSSYAWAQFPYDNVCDPGEPVDGFSGKYTNVTDGNDKLVSGDGIVEVTQDTNVLYCDQSFR
jgi:hypothetical protein